MAKLAWRNVVRQSHPELQGTMDMILPPAQCKFICRLGSEPGAFAGVWFKGADRRSETGRERLRVRNEARSLQYSARHAWHEREVDEEDL